MAHPTANDAADRRSGPVVVGFDGSPAALDALALGELLAKALGAPIELACVHPRRWGPRLAGAEDLVTAANARLSEAPIENGREQAVGRRAVGAASPSAGLAKVAEDLEAALVVVGSTHRGALDRVVPGSVADKLLPESPCLMAIAPRGYAETRPSDARVVAAAYDGSPESEAALAHAVALADRSEATVRVIAAVHTPPEPDVAPDGFMTHRTLRDAQAAIRRLVAELPASLRPDGRVRTGGPVLVILDEAAMGVDLMYMGARGWGPLRSALLGSVSYGVRNVITCPVLIVPQRAATATSKPQMALGGAR